MDNIHLPTIHTTQNYLCLRSSFLTKIVQSVDYSAAYICCEGRLSTGGDALQLWGKGKWLLESLLKFHYYDKICWRMFSLLFREKKQAWSGMSDIWVDT